MNSKNITFAIISFILTIGIIVYFTSGGNNSSELDFKFKNPLKIEIPDGVAYSLDNENGPEKDLSFRCNLSTGEGYFSIKSENLTWTSSHCQDVVGAVTEVVEGKKPSVNLKIKKISNQIQYRVERNLAL